MNELAKTLIIFPIRSNTDVGECRCSQDQIRGVEATEANFLQSVIQTCQDREFGDIACIPAVQDLYYIVHNVFQTSYNLQAS